MYVYSSQPMLSSLLSSTLLPADILSMAGNGKKDVTLRLSGNPRLRNIIWAFRHNLDEEGDEEGPNKWLSAFSYTFTYEVNA